MVAKASAKDTRTHRVAHGASREYLEDRRRGVAAHAAGRVERVDAEQLVDQAAGDAQHRGAAVLALDVELEGLRLRVSVAHPRLAANVARLAVRVLGLVDEVAGLAHARDRHDLQPAGGGDRLERLKAAAGDISELEASRRRDVAREARATLDQDDVEEAQHGRAAVLDLHDLEALHVARRDEAERVIHSQRREDTDVTLGEHGGTDGAHRGLHGRRLEGGRLEGKDGKHDGYYGSAQERAKRPSVSECQTV